jgi:hypothetical protein
MEPLVSAVSISGFRSVHHAQLDLEPLCALVGEPETGKSNLLAGLRCVLDPGADPVVTDRARGGPDEIRIQATLRSGAQVTLSGRPPETTRCGTPAPPLLFLPAALRNDELLAAPGVGHPAAVLFRRAATDVAGAEPPVIRAVDACLAAAVTGVLLLVEEPELYLRPQGQRLLYRLLRRFVERLPEAGTRAAGPAPVTPDQDFRVLSEFDAERSELLLARAALLVEGLTEKLAFPFVFAALGLDADREGVTIVECGGKANLPLFARVCHAAGVPCVAVHDRDAPIGRRPRLSERVLNAAVREVAGPDRTIVIAPDFEGLVGLPGGERKPEQAWRRFAALSASEIPEPLARGAQLAVDLARGTQR